MFQQEEVPAEDGTGNVPIEKRPGFINAIKLPLVSVIPRKLRSTKVSYILNKRHHN